MDFSTLIWRPYFLLLHMSFISTGYRFLLIGFIGFFGFLLSALGQTQAILGVKITSEEVQRYASEHQADWLAHISPGQQRLFSTAAQLEQRFASLRQGTGVIAEQRKRLMEAADRICTTPIPAYRIPKEGAKFSTEEGWIRNLGSQLMALTLAEKIESSPTRRQRVHDLALALCHYETWGRQGKNGELRNMDLSAGMAASGVSLAYDWNRDLFTDSEKELIRKVMSERARNLLEGLYGSIFWSAWYSQNHNHVSVSGLGLAGLAFLGEIPEASQWLAGAMIDMERAAQTLPADGSSYEGVPYWGFGRASILQFIEATRRVTGSDSLYAYPSMKNAAHFRVGCSVPGLNGAIMWADARGFDVSGPQQILYCLASQYGDGIAQYLADHYPAVNGGSLLSLLYYNPAIKPVAPTQLDYFYSDWNVITSRSGWGDADYMISLKSGETNNHHTQLDIGSLSLNFGGDWLLMTSGYGLGAGGKGFYDRGGGRWNYFSNVTESHSTLLINGKSQRTDAKARGVIDHYVSGVTSMWTEVDMSMAYNEVQQARRRMLHRRGKYILVFDDVVAAEPVDVEWLAQVPPRAQRDKTSIFVEGGAGNLTIRLLGENSPFEPRTPTSSEVDVSPRRMITLASKKKGKDVRFAAMLEPLFAGEPVTLWKTSRAMAEGGMMHTTVQSDSWSDEIWHGPRSVIHFSIADKNDVGTAEAEFFAVGQTDQKLTAVVGGSVRQLRLAPLSIKVATPVDFILDAASDGAFLFDLGTTLKGSFELDNGFILLRENGEPVKIQRGQEVILDAGRYFILRNSEKLPSLKQWASALYPGHNRSSFPKAPMVNVPTSGLNSKIHWEAEAPSSKRYEYAVVTEQAQASEGKALTGFGFDSPSDSVGWKVTVPQAGAYTLKMRFSTTQTEVKFSLLVDGKLPLASAGQSMVRGQKGWGIEKYYDSTSYDWITETVTDIATGQALLIPLTAGEHEIRLANPSEPIHLDFLELVSTP